MDHRPEPDPEDPYSRLNYRRLFAWPERLVRERPFLGSLLSTGPGKNVLDLGCGTGEHARLLASLGYAVTGLDRSEAQVRVAREEATPEGPPPRFVVGDLRDLHAALGDQRFGAALCIGNTLPHLLDVEELRRFLSGLSAHLLPGAPFLLQVLNYERILEKGVRTLPVNVRPGEVEGEEIVFLRLMTPRADGMLLFNPTSLRYRPGAEPPLEVVSARNVTLHPWTFRELAPALEAAGLAIEERHGGMRREPYVAGESPDLVLVARSPSAVK